MAGRYESAFGAGRRQSPFTSCRPRFEPCTSSVGRAPDSGGALPPASAAAANAYSKHKAEDNGEQLRLDALITPPVEHHAHVRPAKYPPIFPNAATTTSYTAATTARAAASRSSTAAAETDTVPRCSTSSYTPVYSLKRYGSSAAAPTSDSASTCTGRPTPFSAAPSSNGATLSRVNSTSRPPITYSGTMTSNSSCTNTAGGQPTASSSAFSWDTSNRPKRRTSRTWTETSVDGEVPTSPAARAQPLRPPSPKVRSPPCTAVARSVTSRASPHCASPRSTMTLPTASTSSPLSCTNSLRPGRSTSIRSTPNSIASQQHSPGSPPQSLNVCWPPPTRQRDHQRQTAERHDTSASSDDGCNAQKSPASTSSCGESTLSTDSGLARDPGGTLKSVGAAAAKGNCTLVRGSGVAGQRHAPYLRHIDAGDNDQDDKFDTCTLVDDSGLDVEPAECDQPLQHRKQRRTSLVLRTQPSVRVQTIIDKLLNATGRDLRRALFTLKQIFQDDKDLVQEFVQSGGLACLVQVGSTCDQNHQNYILRALGQIMLYVDGMNGVMAHNETVQWLYELLESPYRLVSKTALKLLLVFVEYADANALLIVAAAAAVDRRKGQRVWAHVISLLTDGASTDCELLAYAMTLVNKTLNALPDQDSFYDLVDALEEQGLEQAVTRMTTMGNEDLTDQCNLYERLVASEDQVQPPLEHSQMAQMRTAQRLSSGGSTGTMSRRRQQQQPQQRSTPPPRQSPALSNAPSEHSSRHSAVSERSSQQNGHDAEVASALAKSVSTASSASTQSRASGNSAGSRPPWRQVTPESNAGSYANGDVDVDVELSWPLTKPSTSAPPADDEEERVSLKRDEPLHAETDRQNSPATEWRQTPSATHSNGTSRTSSSAGMRCPPPTVPTLDVDEATPNGVPETAAVPSVPCVPPPPPPPMVNGNAAEPQKPPIEQRHGEDEEEEEEEEDDTGCTSAFAAALRKGRRGMVKKLEARGPIDTRSEADVQWEAAREQLKLRPLIINDLDFSDFANPDDDVDPTRLPPPSMGAAPAFASFGGAPPPPPPLPGMGVPPPPPPLPGAPGAPPPPPAPFHLGSGPPPAPNGDSARAASPGTSTKTVKLHWKEAHIEQVLPVNQKRGVFWEKVRHVQIDQEKLAQLFETKTKDVMPKLGDVKKSNERKAELRVLGTKRSNAINIGLTKLPPAKAIKQAILKFDSTILSKEGLEKIMDTLLPTDEEKELITTAQAEHPDTPLGTAEQFVMLLASVPDLEPRLRLWLFMMDYACVEKEVAEPLMDLKLAMEELEGCATFQYVLSTLLAVGNFLNGVEAKGFQLEYLAKVPEVKDTVHKHSLVHHLCTLVMDQYPDSTDLYSDMGAVARCAKVDFDEVGQILDKLEKDCKRSWGHLETVAKHEQPAFKTKVSTFLNDCAVRILALKTIYRRVVNRFRSYLLYMGMGSAAAKDAKVNTICKTVSEFGLEYRTSRERILQQRKRLAEKRERNKTRGKMWAQAPGQPPAFEQHAPAPGRSSTNAPVPNGSAVSSPAVAAAMKATEPADRDRLRHAEMSRALLSNVESTSTGDLQRTRLRPAQDRASQIVQDRNAMRLEASAADPIDGEEILDGLVKAATIRSDASVRERRRARQFNRKSMRRTRTLKLTDDQVDTPVC